MHTFKSPFSYLAAAIGLILVATLGGCVMIPYETPEAKAKIQHDLKLDPSDIQAVSETNWCFHPYGSEASCKATQGLGVLTSKGLILSLYNDKTYTEITRILPEQVQCVKTTAGREGVETFMVFTKDQGIMLAAITPGGQLNMPVKLKFFDYLTSRRPHVFVGSEGVIARKTDRQQSVVGVLPGTTIPWHARLDIWEIVNPCPQVKD
ncbi:MAG: hypothetical protein ACN6QH_23785 [Pseudomonas sp.]|uniref:hypothetical protein n=1 Tax=Pseudomonas sp. TaxID=306 RepID=UPI003D0F54F6